MKMGDTLVWFIRYKKDSGKPFVNVNDAIEEAICFGWIDSLPRKLDEERTMLYFAPRKKGSNWSALNNKRAEKMVEAGLPVEKMPDSQAGDEPAPPEEAEKE